VEDKINKIKWPASNYTIAGRHNLVDRAFRSLRRVVMQPVGHCVRSADGVRACDATKVQVTGLIAQQMRKAIREFLCHDNLSDYEMLLSQSHTRFGSVIFSTSWILLVLTSPHVYIR
jgi:hypothetical protein